MKRFVSLLTLVPLFAACDDATGPADGAPVDIRFATAQTQAAFSADLATTPARAVTLPAEDGVFEIQNLEFVVSEFELEGPDSCVAHDEDEGEGVGEEEECEFEGGPFLVDVPLDGTPLTIATDQVTDGTYTFLEFEIEDLEFDEEDEDDHVEESHLAGILADLRLRYPDLPEGASMVVKGRFVPTTGEPQPFTVYFAAEIEMEMPLNPPLNVPADGELTIVVDPATWFAGVDLLQLDGQLVEFELEIEDGFVEIEIDD